MPEEFDYGPSIAIERRESWRHEQFGSRIAAFEPVGSRIPVRGSLRGALGMTERRLARRYDLALPVIVQLPINKEASPHNGQTRDISTRGVYFVLHKELQPGTELDFTLTLPAEITQGTEVFVRAHGRVVRVDRKSEAGAAADVNVGVAAVIERYDIIRGEPVRA